MRGSATDVPCADRVVIVDGTPDLPSEALCSAIALAIEHLDLARHQTGWREEHIAAVREVLEAALREAHGPHGSVV